MKKVPKSTKAKGKEVAREVNNNAGLPNGNADLASSTPGADDENDDDHKHQRRDQEEHDRDATMVSYRTAQEADEEDDTEESESSGDDDDHETEGDGDSSSEAPSKHAQPKRIGQSHDRSKRPRPVQDIFRDESLTKVGCITR